MSNHFDVQSRFVSDHGARDGSKEGLESQKDSMMFKKKRGLDDEFAPIFIVAAMIGLPVSPSLLPSKQTFWGLARPWSHAVFGVRTVCIAVECAHNHLLWPSVALRTCNLVHCLTGYSILLIFAAHRRKLAAAVDKMGGLTSGLLPYGARKRSYVKYLIVLCFLVIAGVAAISVESFRRDWDSHAEKISSMVPFLRGSSFAPVYNCFVVFSFVLSYHISTATLYVTLFLCVASYRSGGRLFALYGNKLRADVSDGSFRLDAASQNTLLFRDITFGLHEMDSALSGCAMIIYVAVINNVFNLLSVVLSSDGVASQVDAFVALSIASALVQFFCLTFSGESVRQQSESLKNDLIGLSDCVIRRSEDASSIVMFNLLSENIKSTKAAVTGLGLFTITKRFIPSAVGVTVTYGVLLYQIGATAEA